jgi:TRAP-type C4-dicarboxylate transport system substrate-binding protein
MLDAIILGNLDIAKVSTGVISTVVPEFGVFDLPYVFRDLNHMMATTKSKVGQDLVAKLEARNVKVLFWMEQGTRSFYTASKQVRTPSDLKGMKIRTIASPVMVDTINALGASATPMGFGDLYLGLKSGLSTVPKMPRMQSGTRSTTKWRSTSPLPITFAHPS